ncbi:MAG: GldG family protein [Chloroflexi bacterium]|nr:GldG family protein [Chloroflexota bacterium]
MRESPPAPSFLRRLRSFLGTQGLIFSSIGAIALLASIVVFLLFPELKTSALILLAIGLVFLLLSLLVSFGRVRAALTGRTGRYGLNTGITLAAFFGILVLLNIIAARNNQRFDLTSVRQFTLSPQTLRILKDLKEPIVARGFFVASDQLQYSARTQAENLLREYARKTNMLRYEFVDPEQEPALFAQYELKEYGTVFFESSERKVPVYTLAQESGTSVFLEQNFTAAILKATGTKQKKVYFLSGHDERDIFNMEAMQGYGLAREGIERDNYEVTNLDLSITPQVPEDATVLIVAGPKKDLLDQEIAPLENYLARGGKAMFLLDPDPLPTFRNILSKWGVVSFDGVLVDPGSALLGDPLTPVVPRSRLFYSQVTAGLDAAFFPGATFFDSYHGKPIEEVNVYPFLISSRDSWLETDPEVAEFTQGVDEKGPLAIGIVVEATAPLEGEPPPMEEKKGTTRLIVIGDSDFAINIFFPLLSNGDTLLNAVNWLAEEEELISIRPKQALRFLVVSPREWRWILYSSLTFLPLAVIVAGGIIWWRRR